jgi:protein TonB
MSYKYNETFIEKTFLYLLAISLVLHTAMFVLIAYIPQEQKKAAREPIMIDLQDLPTPNETPARDKKEVKRFAEERHRVARETAPRGERERDRLAPPSRPAAPPSDTSQRRSSDLSPWMPDRSRPQFPPQPGESPLKPKEERGPKLAQLFPSAGRMARLEESYRKKYGPEVEEGDTKFLDTDDIQFGSFLRRFENAVYGVWTYPQEAARMGIEGVTPVKITFNRKGEIEKVSIMESSGSTTLDNEVLRTLSLIGAVGPFPKGYNKDKFNLIAFFQYGINRGFSRGVLH